MRGDEETGREERVGRCVEHYVGLAWRLLSHVALEKTAHVSGCISSILLVLSFEDNLGSLCEPTFAPARFAACTAGFRRQRLRRRRGKRQQALASEQEAEAAAGHGDGQGKGGERRGRGEGGGERDRGIDYEWRCGALAACGCCAHVDVVRLESECSGGTSALPETRSVIVTDRSGRLVHQDSWFRV